MVRKQDLAPLLSARSVVDVRAVPDVIHQEVIPAPVLPKEGEVPVDGGG